MQLATAQAAAIVRLSEQAIRDHINAGRLPAHRQGIRALYKIELDDLRAFALRYNYPLNEEYLATLAQ
jgi:excisionase family DNA binding protein